MESLVEMFRDFDDFAESFYRNGRKIYLIMERRSVDAKDS